MNKKGDLALSVNAIVIVVISFVVLGLALTLTRNIFKFAGERAESVIPLTELEAKPTAENPIAIPETISIKKDSKLAQSVGFYNANSFTAKNARFDIFDCLYTDPQTKQEVSVRNRNDQLLPTVISPAQTVDPSISVGYIIIINENGLQGGITYICKLVVHNLRTPIRSASDLEPNNKKEDGYHETKEIFINIIA